MLVIQIRTEQLLQLILVLFLIFNLNFLGFSRIFSGFTFPVISGERLIKTFYCENIRDFLVLEQFKSNFPKYKKLFVLFFKLGFKRALSSYFCKTSHGRCLALSWICVGSWIYQGSEYAFSSKYARVLNKPFPKYKKVPLCQSSE